MSRPPTFRFHLESPFLIWPTQGRKTSGVSSRQETETSKTSDGSKGLTTVGERREGGDEDVDVEDDEEAGMIDE